MDDAVPPESTGSEALGLEALYDTDDDFDRQLVKLLEGPTAAGVEAPR